MLFPHRYDKYAHCDYCDYCDSGKVIIESPEAGVYISGNVLMLRSYSGESNHDSIVISSCPICGKTLKDDSKWEKKNV